MTDLGGVQEFPEPIPMAVTENKGPKKKTDYIFDLSARIEDKIVNGFGVVHSDTDRFVDFTGMGSRESSTPTAKDVIYLKTGIGAIRKEEPNMNQSGIELRDILEEMRSIENRLITGPYNASPTSKTAFKVAKEAIEVDLEENFYGTQRQFSVLTFITDMRALFETHSTYPDAIRALESKIKLHLDETGFNPNRDIIVPMTQEVEMLLASLECYVIDRTATPKIIRELRDLFDSIKDGNGTCNSVDFVKEMNALKQLLNNEPLLVRYRKETRKFLAGNKVTEIRLHHMFLGSFKTLRLFYNIYLITCRMMVLLNAKIFIGSLVDIKVDSDDYDKIIEALAIPYCGEINAAHLSRTKKNIYLPSDIYYKYNIDATEDVRVRRTAIAEDDELGGINRLAPVIRHTETAVQLADDADEAKSEEDVFIAQIASYNAAYIKAVNAQSITDEELDFLMEERPYKPDQSIRSGWYARCTGLGAVIDPLVQYIAKLYDDVHEQNSTSLEKGQKSHVVPPHRVIESVNDLYSIMEHGGEKLFEHVTMHILQCIMNLVTQTCDQIQCYTTPKEEGIKEKLKKLNRRQQVISFLPYRFRFLNSDANERFYSYYMYKAFYRRFLISLKKEAEVFNAFQNKSLLYPNTYWYQKTKSQPDIDYIKVLDSIRRLYNHLSTFRMQYLSQPNVKQDVTLWQDLSNIGLHEDLDTCLAEEKTSFKDFKVQHLKLFYRLCEYCKDLKQIYMWRKEMDQIFTMGSASQPEAFFREINLSSFTLNDKLFEGEITNPINVLDLFIKGENILKPMQIGLLDEAYLEKDGIFIHLTDNDKDVGTIPGFYITYGTRADSLGKNFRVRPLKLTEVIPIVKPLGKINSYQDMKTGFEADFKERVCTNLESLVWSGSLPLIPKSTFFISDLVYKMYTPFKLPQPIGMVHLDGQPTYPMEEATTSVPRFIGANKILLPYFIELHKGGTEEKELYTDPTIPPILRALIILFSNLKGYGTFMENYSLRERSAFAVFALLAKYYKLFNVTGYDISFKNALEDYGTQTESQALNFVSNQCSKIWGAFDKKDEIPHLAQRLDADFEETPLTITWRSFNLENDVLIFDAKKRPEYIEYMSVKECREIFKPKKEGAPYYDTLLTKGTTDKTTKNYKLKGVLWKNNEGGYKVSTDLLGIGRSLRYSEGEGYTAALVDQTKVIAFLFEVEGAQVRKVTAPVVISVALPAPTPLPKEEEDDEDEEEEEDDDDESYKGRDEDDDEEDNVYESKDLDEEELEELGRGGSSKPTEETKKKRRLSTGATSAIDKKPKPGL